MCWFFSLCMYWLFSHTWQYRNTFAQASLQRLVEFLIRQITDQLTEFNTAIMQYCQRVLIQLHPGMKNLINIGIQTRCQRTNRNHFSRLGNT